MTDDRKRKRHHTGGWTPQDLGLSAVKRGITALAMTAGIGNAGRRRAAGRADRYPRPVQSSAEQRRRLRQQDRLAQKRNTQNANA